MSKTSNKREIDEEEDNIFTDWGKYFDAKKAKLEDQFNKQCKQTNKISDIFKGVAIFVNGHTDPTAEQLRELMAEHGGIYHTYQTAKTTHIIASNLPNVKINKLGSVPIVKPSWIEDCLKNKRLLDYTKYLLYTNQNRVQPKLQFKTETATKTASDDGFISEFYNNSRLHLIATLGTEAKELINTLREKSNNQFIGLEKLTSLQKCDEKYSDKVIMHIDMDCFFVSVGLVSRPELKGKPVAVTHSKGGPVRSHVDRQAEFDLYNKLCPETGRVNNLDNKSSMSEIASCSYEARKRGIKNGMFMGAALKMCPDLVAIPYDFQQYRKVSKILYETVAEYTLNIEAVSCDEMYVDITSILAKNQLSIDVFATHLRGEILQRTGCNCSAGFGANRLQARLATKSAKPAGQFYLQPRQVKAYLYDLPVKELPGIGYSNLAKLSAIGIETCGDVQASALGTLQRELGKKLGESIFDQANGIDHKPLQYEHERKSVSAEINYGIRFQTEEEAFNFIEKIAGELQKRLVECNMKCKSVTLKIMVKAADAPQETAKFLGHGVCDSLTRSAALNAFTNDKAVIFREVKSLYKKLNIPFADLRGLGIQATKLEKIASSSNSNFMQEFLNKSSNKAIKSDKPKSVTTTKRTQQESLNNFYKVTQKQRPIINKDIDLNVLKELPPDIRDDVLKEYQLDANILNEDTNTKEKKANIIETVSIFKSLSDNDFKLMLRQWLKQPKPSRIDSNMLAKHLKSLVQQRHIEKLFALLKFLLRLVNASDNCVWHRIYLDLIKTVQNVMMDVYKNELFLPETLLCQKHE